MDTLANSEGPDEMLQNAAFHRLLRSKQFPGSEVQLNLDNLTCDPFI